MLMLREELVGNRERICTAALNPFAVRNSFFRLAFSGGIAYAFIEDIIRRFGGAIRLTDFAPCDVFKLCHIIEHAASVCNKRSYLRFI